MVNNAYPCTSRPHVIFWSDLSFNWLLVTKRTSGRYGYGKFHILQYIHRVINAYPVIWRPHAKFLPFWSMGLAVMARNTCTHIHKYIHTYKLMNLIYNKYMPFPVESAKDSLGFIWAWPASPMLHPRYHFIKEFVLIL